MSSPHALRCGLLAALVLALPARPQETGAQEFEPIRFGDPEELAYTTPFFAGATYDPAIPTPDSILGQTHGTRLSRHDEVLACFRALAAASPRMVLEEMGRTHEGRELVYAVVTSERNHARLDAILADLARLANPKGLSSADGKRIVTETPPVGWMGYSIHGDELSGTDAAVALAYHLTAATNREVAELLDSIVVVIDPCMNPDGRERIVSMVEQSAGYTPNLDYASMHRGRWPYGRGNHYLFDMNRDWMAGTQPETRARWRVVLRFRPQLFVDAHEMGSLDTYLFYPQAEPLNPFLQERHLEWQRTFAAGIAAAFDGYGWSYYTREWADGWAPFYSDAWGSLIGAVGILYEQANTHGSPLRRASGEVLTYRETVHHQATASLANLETLAEQRESILRSYVSNQRVNIAGDTPGNERVFVLRTGGNPTRERELLRILLAQGIEVFRIKQGVQARAGQGALGERLDTLSLPAGALLVAARQPARQFVRAFLDFDPRLDREALQREREELERKGESKIYDVTSWSLAHALALDAWWCDAVFSEKERVTAVPEPRQGIFYATDGQREATAWVVDGGDDGSVVFAARAMELGLQVNFADREFSTGRERFARGSLLVRRTENPGPIDELLRRLRTAAREANVVVWATETGRSPDEGPDLGGQHFHLLARPRVAVLANSPVSSDLYGHLWHHLDRVLGVPFTIVDAQALRGTDLRRYNVLILPPAGGLESLLEPLKDELESWLEGGGTLVACAGSAAALTKERMGLSSVMLRRHALEELDAYALAAERQRASRQVEIDESLVWNGVPLTAETPGETGETEGDEESEPEEEAESLDAWRRRFAPHGVHLLAHANPDEWITAGYEDRLPVFFSGSNVLLSKEFVPVRLGRQEELRLGGLLWPEARERLAESAYLTVERKGDGQIVLFASMPAFRGYELGTGRLFSNAVVYGPGLGARQPIGW